MIDDKYRRTTPTPRAIILAAGRGSRLHPYTENTPKCLTELGGMTLIDRQIATLRAAGIDDIVIVTGYRREQLVLSGTRQVFNPDWAKTNMVASLFCAESLFGDDVVVAYSDIVYEPRVLDALLASQDSISVVIDRQWQALWELRFENPLDDAESLRVGEAGRILDIGSKAETIAEIEGQYIGLMRFRGDGVRALIETQRALGQTPRSWMEKRPVHKAYMTDLLMEMILAGMDVMAVPVNGGWLEIDTVSDFETMARMMSEGSLTPYFDVTARRSGSKG